MRTRSAIMSRLSLRCAALFLAAALAVPVTLMAQSRSDVIAVQQSLIHSLSPRVLGLMTDAAAVRTVVDLNSYPGEATSQRIQYTSAEATALAQALKLPVASSAERLRCDSTTKRCELLPEGIRVVAFSQPKFKDNTATVSMKISRNIAVIDINRPETPTQIVWGHCYTSTLVRKGGEWIVDKSTFCPRGPAEPWKLFTPPGGNR